MGHSKYRILGLVGQGQFGRVYCASVRRIAGKDPGSTTKLVALKELSHQRAPTSEFLRELWFLITLQHPNIVTCRALEHTATGRYLVMDYCEGGTLRALMEQERPLRLMEGLELILGVLGGLEYAHDR
ncbi:MAG: protein kinase domain-containing protein, partial [Microcoleaceae cyanobacterium]